MLQQVHDVKWTSFNLNEMKLLGEKVCQCYLELVTLLPFGKPRKAEARRSLNLLSKQSTPLTVGQFILL